MVSEIILDTHGTHGSAVIPGAFHSPPLARLLSLLFPLGSRDITFCLFKDVAGVRSRRGVVGALLPNSGGLIPPSWDQPADPDNMIRGVRVLRMGVIL